MDVIDSDEDEEIKSCKSTPLNGLDSKRKEKEKYYYTCVIP